MCLEMYQGFRFQFKRITNQQSSVFGILSCSLQQGSWYRTQGNVSSYALHSSTAVFDTTQVKKPQQSNSTWTPLFWHDEHVKTQLSSVNQRVLNPFQMQRDNKLTSDPPLSAAQPIPAPCSCYPISFIGFQPISSRFYSPQNCPF